MATQLDRLATTRPAGINPAGINPAGVNPAGVNPAGVNPAGVSPAGVNPAGVNDLGTVNRPTLRSAADARTRTRADGNNLQDQLNKKFEDESAGKALSALPKEGTISGFDFRNAIENGTSDLDNHAAGPELRDISNFVAANKDRMSPEAMAAFADYQRVAKAQGENTGIPVNQWNQMLDTMKHADVHASVQNIANRMMERNGTTGQLAFNENTRRYEVTPEAMKTAAEEVMKGNRKPMEDLYQTYVDLSKAVQEEGQRSNAIAQQLVNDPADAQRAGWMSDRGSRMQFVGGSVAMENTRYATQLKALVDRMKLGTPAAANN